MAASDLQEKLFRGLRKIKVSTRLWKQQAGLTVFATFPDRGSAVDMHAELKFVGKKLAKTPLCKSATMIDQTTMRIDGVSSRKMDELKTYLKESGADSLTIRGAMKAQEPDSEKPPADFW